jgi:hypothetical protein
MVLMIYIEVIIFENQEPLANNLLYFTDSTGGNLVERGLLHEETSKFSNRFLQN